MSIARCITVIGTWVVCTAAFAAEPVFTLGEDGSTFLYRARPGDRPAAIAEMFGIKPADVPALLAANGITDPTRIPTGQVFRIANPVAEQAKQADAKAATLERELQESRARVTTLERDVAGAKAAATDASRLAERSARFASIWWIAVSVAVLLAAATGFALLIAVRAVRQRRHDEQYARTLADELEEKRRRGLDERRETAKRILDLETQVRHLEMKRILPPSPPRRSGTGGR
jgi:hypothetical protein